MSWELGLVAVALVLAAVNAGSFFAFSNFVMQGLGALPGPAGAAAMQEINRTAPNPVFVGAIVGAGLVGVPPAITTGGGWILAGAVLSLASLLITVAGNVPRNNALDRADVATSAGIAYWQTYLVSWTRLNTIRTLTSLTSVLAYGLALRGL